MLYGAYVETCDIDGLVCVRLFGFVLVCFEMITTVIGLYNWCVVVVWVTCVVVRGYKDGTIANFAIDVFALGVLYSRNYREEFDRSVRLYVLLKRNYREFGN